MELKQAEQRLTYLASFPERNPNPVMEVALDGSIQYANPAARRLFPDLETQGLAHPWLTRWAAVTQPFRDGLTETSLRDVAVSERIFQQALHYFPAEQFVRIYGFDVSERKRAEEALRESEARLRMHIERMPIGCIAHDKNNCFSQLNPAAERIFGYSEAELRGKHANLIVPEAARPHVDTILRRLAEGDMTAHSVNENVTKDGRTIVCEWTNTPLRDPSGRFAGILSMVQDVTERKRAEEALLESESFHRQTLESIPGMVFTTRPDGYCDYQSQQWVDYTGVPMSEHVGDGWNKLLHPDDRPRAFAAWRAAVEGRAPYDLEYRVRRCDGQYEWFKVRGTPIRDAAGQIVRWFGVATNIHELKQAEEALHESEQRLRLAQQAAKLGAFEWNVQTGVNVWTPELEAMHGLAPGEFGRTQPAWEQLVHPEDRATAVGWVDHAFATGEPVEGEWRIVWRDGSIHWISGRFQVFKDAAGKPLRLAGVNIDITSRKRAEEQLKALHADLERRIELRTAELATANRALERENAERGRAEEAQRVLVEAFRDLYNNAPCGYHSLDADGVFAQMNDTELKWLGYERDEVIGKMRFDDLLTPEGKEAFRHNFALLKERGEVRDLEYRMLRKDGTVLPVLLSATAGRDDKGGFLMSRATIFDMTERKKIEAEAVRAAKLATLGELAASVAHEINNPINSIINYAQILADKGDRQRKEYALTEEIIQEGMRIASIVKNLLSFARDTKDRKTSLSVSHLISSSFALANALMRKEGVRLRVKVACDLPPVVGNAQQLQQVFLNIISNASHALQEKYPGPHEDKVLEISAESAASDGGGVVRISFCDHGTGIPASILGKVKEPFFTTKPGSLGTGLGLSISNTIISDHKGSLIVDSTEGEYTRVTVELPVDTASDKEVRR